MKLKAKSRVKRKVNEEKPAEEYSEKLVQEVKEALRDYKNGKSFKGTAEEIIKHLHDEADKDKKV